MEGKVLIRQFNTADTLAVQQLIDEVLKEYGFSFNPESPVDEDLTRIRELYGNNFWVAVADDEIIGTVALREVTTTIVKLKRMFVKKEYRGKHIGWQLLTTAIEKAKQQSYKEIILNTSPSMQRVHAFYERFGFKKIEEDKDRIHYKLTLEN